MAYSKKEKEELEAGYASGKKRHAATHGEHGVVDVRYGQRATQTPNQRTWVRNMKAQTLREERSKKRGGGGGPAPKAMTQKVCRRGHPMTEANTIHKKEGGTKCRTCFNAAARARKAAARA